MVFFIHICTILPKAICFRLRIGEVDRRDAPRGCRLSENGVDARVTSTGVVSVNAGDRDMQDNPRPQKHTRNTASKYRLPTSCPTCDEPIVGLEASGPATQKAIPCGHTARQIRPMTHNEIQSDASPAIADLSDQEVATIEARIRDSIERPTDQPRPAEGSQ